MYKLPLLTSLTLAIVIIALDVTRAPLTIAFIILGVLAGTFILDLDYFIYALFLEPDTDFSKTVSAFIKHSDIKGALQYIQYHREEISDLTLHSVVFQLVLVGAVIFGVSSANNFFVKALVLSTYLNSIYRLIELYLANNHEKWFWSLKKIPGKKAVIIYVVALLAVLVFCLTIL